jgi:hypothetical protein
MNKSKTVKLMLSGAALLLSTGAALASSHREAPAIAQDACADNTDVYMFISPDNPDNLVVVANYVPLLLPSSGPNFHSFCDNVSYDINFDNDGDARTDVRYRFKFDTAVQNGDTFLYNTGAVGSLTDPNLNVRQTYKVIRSEGWQHQTLATGVQVAPWNVGKRSFPNDSYESVALSAVTDVGNKKFFAGPRDESFFVDLHVFDLLGVGGAPTTDGVNVMSLVMEIPITDVSKGGVRPADASSPEAIVGIYASSARKRKRILRRNRAERNRGRSVQVSRLAWPLVNEVLVPLKDKDKYNRSKPKDDLANIGSYVLFPELPGLLNAVLGAGCADTPASGRTDIAGLLSPNGTTIADLLRINIAQGQGPSDSGFPNGRALSDDVTDTLLTVLCNNGGPLGDGVDGNDLEFTWQMPYLASPHSGNP